jgi:ABC-type multidrug transport system ATPase subunit
MAMTIVESMKHLAQQGKTIICTIHQPSSEIFECFDTLYLMAEGRLAYSGSLENAADFFSRLLSEKEFIWYFLKRLIEMLNLRKVRAISVRRTTIQPTSISINLPFRRSTKKSVRKR